MERKIKIKAGRVEVAAVLNDSGTAVAVWESLPFKGKVSLWGEEIYFSIPLDLDLENGQEVVNIGDLGYWPQGRAFCIFFGLTPVSEEGKIRPASAVSVFGKVVDDTSVLRQVSAGEEIVIEKDTDA